MEVNAVPAAVPRPESQEEILAAALAALTGADIPPGEHEQALPSRQRPAGGAGRADRRRAGGADRRRAGPGGRAVAGRVPAAGRDRPGGGFADGGALDVLVPGVPLAGFADEAHARLSAVSDDELIGVLRAWWRQTSWAQVRALAAIAELAARRPADRTPPAAPGEFPATLSEFLPDEVGMALTLTKAAAETQVELALQLAGRPATAAALEAGRIDLRKAVVILDAVGPLSAEHAAAVEAAVLPAAAGQTTGELRKSVTAAVLALDPDAVRRRREEAEKRARVECYPDPDGTAALTGRSLPPPKYSPPTSGSARSPPTGRSRSGPRGNKLTPTGSCRGPSTAWTCCGPRPTWRCCSASRSTPRPPAGLLPVAPEATGPDSSDGSSPDGPTDPDANTGPDGKTGPDSPDSPAGGGDGQPVPESQHLPARLRRPDPVAGLPPMAGLISLTLPLTTLLDLSDRPGEAAGYGPLHADTARLLACALAGHRATRWQVILTDPDGHALAAGTARGSPAAPSTPTPPAARTGTAAAAGGRSRSPPSPSPPPAATTATPNPATGPAPPCNASSAPAPAPAAAPAAAAPPPAPTSTTPSPTTTAASPANATADQ